MAATSQRLTLGSDEFQRKVSLREAYLIMEELVTDYYKRGDTSVFDFLCYLGVTISEESGDPAAFEDFFNAVEKVAGGSDETA